MSESNRSVAGQVAVGGLWGVAGRSAVLICILARDSIHHQAVWAVQVRVVVAVPDLAHLGHPGRRRDGDNVHDVSRLSGMLTATIVEKLLWYGRRLLSR